MKELQVFTNEQFGQVRVMDKGGEPWFVLKDVCSVLEIKNATDVAKRLEEDEVTRLNLGGLSGVANLINESGLYAVILRSDKPQAKQFRKWVTSEVLPTIRKTGKYEVNTQDLELKARLAKVKEQNARTREANAFMRLAEKIAIPEYQSVLYSYSSKALTGEHVLPLPVVTRKTYSATEIGEMLGITKNMVGILTNRHHLKTEQYGKMFYDKSRSSNKEVESFRYYIEIVDVLRGLLEVA